MSLLADAVASFHMIRTALDQQHRFAHDLADRLHRSAPRLTKTIATSTHPSARKAVSDLNAAIEHLREAAQLAAQSETAITEYVSIITGTPPAAVADDQMASQPIRPQKAAIEEIRPHVGRDVAVGRLYDSDGQPLTPLFGPGDSDAGHSLNPPLPSLRFITHIEANASAHMRRHHIQHAVLYTNMRPCLGTDGCTYNIKATLPKGYRLTVHQVRPNGGVRVWQFHGTGKGITDDPS